MQHAMRAVNIHYFYVKKNWWHAPYGRTDLNLHGIIECKYYRVTFISFNASQCKYYNIFIKLKVSASSLKYLEFTVIYINLQ